MTIDKEPQKQNGDSFESTTTPTSNETLTHAVLGPKYVIPIIFIPGIMGSNIMNNKGKKVWFPPNGILAGAGAAFHGKFFRSASNRQTELDPATTFVSNEGDIKINKKAIKGFGENEARARGWGTVYWDGYGEGMVFLEQFLNSQLINLITYHRKNMQSIQLSASDEYHLKQRNKIETLFSLLKGQYNLVTSKARSIHGFLSGIYASLCAYQLTHRNKQTIQIMESLA
jgi:hypothetical protein